jgi:hypothetical protein
MDAFALYIVFDMPICIQKVYKYTDTHTYEYIDTFICLCSFIYEYMFINAGTLQDTVERMKIELENSREESQRLHSIQIGKCWLRVILIREEGLKPSSREMSSLRFYFSNNYCCQCHHHTYRLRFCNCTIYNFLIIPIIINMITIMLQ